MNKPILSDKDLLIKILTGNTKDPISLEDWTDFVKNTTLSIENTLLFINICKFTETFDNLCKSINLASNLKEEVVVTKAINGLFDYQCSITDESGLKEFAERISNQLITKFIKAGSEFEVNLSSKIRTDCLSELSSGKHHPNSFVGIKNSIFADILLNDLPQFKEKALNQNIAAEHRRMRFFLGLVTLSSLLMTYSLLLAYNATQYYRLLGLPMTYYVFLFYFQYKAKFCVTFAGAGRRNVQGYSGIAVEDEYACKYQKNRAKNIKIKSWVGGLVLLIILFVVPPYKWIFQ